MRCTIETSIHKMSSEELFPIKSEPKYIQYQKSVRLLATYGAGGGGVLYSGVQGTVGGHKAQWGDTRHQG
jgi:hypothetical protein